MSRGVLVHGTGRSGTSLTMQALKTLGVQLPERAVSPSENNLRETGEALELRDIFHGMPKFTSFRPDGWLETEPMRDVMESLANYLRYRSASAGPAGFADKFPLSSVVLPLWIEAAKHANVPLVHVWATRRPEATIVSMIRAYDHPPERAARIWAQRLFHLLGDLPEDTYVLPYERWQQSPQTQMEALARVVGIKAQKTELPFDRSLDHSAAPIPKMSPATLRAFKSWTKAFGMQSGVLSAIKAERTEAILEFRMRLADVLIEIGKEASGTSMIEIEARMALWRETKRNKDDGMVQQVEMGNLLARISDLERELSEEQERAVAQAEALAKAERLREDYFEITIDQDRLKAEILGTHLAAFDRVEERLERLTRQQSTDKAQMQKEIEKADHAIKAAQQEITKAQQARQEAEKEAREARQAAEKEIQAAHIKARTEIEAVRIKAQTEIQATQMQARAETEAAQMKAMTETKAAQMQARTEIKEMRRQKELAIQSVNREYRTSTSWRLTYPLRALSLMFRRQTGK